MQLDGRPVHNSESTGMIENADIIGTPFRLVGIVDHEKTGWFIAMGNERISDIHDTQEEALDLVIKRDINLIANMCLVIVKHATELEETKNNAGL